MLKCWTYLTAVYLCLTIALERMAALAMETGDVAEPDLESDAVGNGVWLTEAGVSAVLPSESVAKSALICCC